MKRQQQEQTISVLLPVHNAELTLRRCLDSLLSQTYHSIEVIAIDDNSKDSSYKILRTYRKLDKRVIISRNVKHYGLSITLNRAMRKARGQYIAFIDQKDSQTPDRLKRQLLYLKRNPKTVAVGTQTAYLDRTGKKLTRSTFPTDDTFIKQTFLTSSSMLFESLLINRFLLPSDLLKFRDQKHPLLFHSLMVKMLPYGQFANLNHALYLRTREEVHPLDEFSTKLFSHLFLWLKARFVYDSQPSVRSLITPFNTRLRSLT